MFSHKYYLMHYGTIYHCKNLLPTSVGIIQSWLIFSRNINLDFVLTIFAIKNLFFSVSLYVSSRTLLKMHENIQPEAVSQQMMHSRKTCVQCFTTEINISFSRTFSIQLFASCFTTFSLSCVHFNSVHLVGKCFPSQNYFIYEAPAPVQLILPF